MRLCVLFVLLCSFFSLSAQEFKPYYYDIGSPKLTQLYVDPARGDDNNSGTTNKAPFKSLDAAWRSIPAQLTLAEGFQINLADSLLIGPGADHISAVTLLVIQGKVLDVGVDPLALGAGHCSGSDLTTQNAVLGVVFKVTATEGGTVGVHGWGIPTGDAHLTGHLANPVAKSLSQIHIPGGGDHHGA